MQPRRTLILNASDHRELLDVFLLAWTHGALGLWETQQDVMKYFHQIDFGKMKKYAFFPLTVMCLIGFSEVLDIPGPHSHFFFS